MIHGLQLAGITVSWLVGLNIDWVCLMPRNIMGARDQWEFPPFFRTQWQSLWTAVTAGICLQLGLSKGTVKESSLLLISPLSTNFSEIWNNFDTTKWIWKCCVQIGGNIISALIRTWARRTCSNWWLGARLWYLQCFRSGHATGFY